ncbi:hypothetical protein IJF85_00780 [Candidatus Saccharibacteria bacterium]|nr:hypothetical protein [Candidatus Saccharibacteria bacterium]
MQVIQKIKEKLNNSPRRVILDTRKKCSNNSTCRIIITALALGIACLSCNAYAEIGSSDVDFSLSVDATPSLEIVLAGDGLTTSPTSLGLNIKPNIDGTPVFGYSDLDVTVATSNATGYYLNFSTTNADGSLRTTSSSTLSTLADTGTFTCTTATASTCSFTTNRWGYKLAQDDATSYIAAPGSDGTKIDEIYTKTNGVTSNLRVGAKVDSSLTAGNYSTTMSFAATAHPTTYGIYYNYGAAEGTSPAPSGLPGNQSGALNNASTTTVTLSSSTPTWTGHTFNKWCFGTVTSTDYANDTCTGTEYSAGDSIVFDINGDVSVTLKAMWNINTYTATIKTATGVSKVTLNGTECTSTSGCNVSNLIYGKGYSLVATLDTGYSLSTWSTTAGTIADNTASTTYTVGAGNATITPGATLNQYNVTVTFNTGANQVSFTNATYGTVTATASSPTVSLYYNQPYTATMSFSSNYEFDSWTAGTNTSVSSTGTNPTTVTLTGAGAGTLTATGKQSGFSYNLTFVGNGGTPSSSSLSGAAMSVTLPTATYHTASTTNTSARYATLAGWSETPNATTADYSGTMNLTANTTKTLYAVWNFDNNTLQNTSSICGNNMIDARTGVSYLTYTISDQCYMEQNLYLPTGFTLYAGDSNIYSTAASKNQQVSWATPTASLTAGDSFTEARMVAGTYTNNTYNATGGWYNYCAASAGTVCDNSTTENANSDICPKGWRLPTVAEMGNVASANRSNWKFYDGFYNNGSIDQASAMSFWWATTAADNDMTAQRALYSMSYGSALGESEITKIVGIFVRCVRNEAATTMQSFSSSNFKSMSVGDSTVLRDSRTGANYSVKMLSLNGAKTLWMMSNLKLPGGTALTTSDSNVTSSYTLPTESWVSNSQDDYCKPYMATAGGEYYYNWPAATARTNNTSNTFTGCSNDTDNSVGDICPKNWRLPVYSGEVDNSTWRSNLQANGSLTTTGWFRSGSQGDVGSYGYWWTSTRYNDDSARYLYSNGGMAVTNTLRKYFGLSVRCMRTS